MEIKTTCKECKGKGHVGNFFSKSTCSRCSGTGRSPTINQVEVEEIFEKIFPWLLSKDPELIEEARTFLAGMIADDYLILREASSDLIRRRKMSAEHETKLLDKNLLNLAYGLVILGQLYHQVAMTNRDDFFRMSIETMEQAILAGQKTSIATTGGANHIFVHAYAYIGECTYFLKDRKLAKNYFQKALEFPLITEQQKKVAGDAQQMARKNLMDMQGISG
jgi:hypothetical protein